MISSRSKGMRYERHVASRFREHGYNAFRGCQFQGGPDSPDVAGIPWIHPECKAVERLNIQEAFDQAKRDAGNKIPVVFHKRNNCEDLVTMRLDDWFELFREYDASMVLAERNEEDENIISRL